MPEPVPGKGAVSVYNWTEYVLTNCDSVKEVVAVMKDLPVVNSTITYNGKVMKGMFLHMAVFDKSGDAAVMEFNNGKLEVFHGPQYNVLTNAPNMHEQLANLAKVRENKTQYTIEQLPGGASAMNRFVRATFDMENMPEPANALEAVIYMEEAVYDIMVPAYIDRIHPGTTLSDAWETRWHTIIDLKNLHLFFDYDQTGMRMNLDVKKIDFKGKSIRYIDPKKSRSKYQLN